MISVILKIKQEVFYFSNEKYIYIYIYTYIYILEEMSWIWQNVCIKIKIEEKYVWWFVYLPTHFDFNLFIAHHNTISQRPGFFFKITPSIGKIISKDFKIHTKD